MLFARITATVIAASARDEPESSAMLQATKSFSDVIANENMLDAEVVEQMDAEVSGGLNEPAMIFLEAHQAPQSDGPGEDQDTLKRLKKALAVAAKDEENEQGASSDSLAEDGTNVTQVTISSAGEALQAINNASAEKLDHLIEVTYADAIREALEVFSEKEDVDQAVKNGDVVTSAELRELNGLTDTPEVSDSPNAVQGDMVGDGKNNTALLQMAAAKGQRWAGTLFALNTPIKYCFDNNIAEASKTAFVHATQHFDRLIPCMSFAQTWYTDECNIKVQSSGVGCNSFVGKMNGIPTLVNLASPGCTSIGIAAHELGHAIGMTHEQSRTDHDQYIQIFWQNIKPSMVSNYVTEAKADTTLAYDFESLMHYGDSDFAYAGYKSMKAVAGHEGAVMGNRMGLTGQDAKQVATMYGCGAQVNFKTCTVNPTKSTFGNCVCHNDLVGTKDVIRITTNDGGYRCVKQCGDYPSNFKAYHCGCPAGCQKLQHSKSPIHHACYSVVNGQKDGCVATKQTPAAVCKDLITSATCSSYTAYCQVWQPLTYTWTDGTVQSMDIATVGCKKTCGKC